MTRFSYLLKTVLLPTFILAILLVSGATRSLAAPVHGALPSTTHVLSLSCTKKVHQGKKIVTKKTCIADLKGNHENLNEILSIGIVLGSSQFCCFNETKKSFLAPAHFQVKWAVSCQNAGGGGTLALFYVVGYDGHYQPEELYTGYNAGSKSGTTNIDTSAVKRWAFVVSDADKQACSYHFTAKKVSV